MTLATLEQRLRKIEKARHASHLSKLTDDELQEAIDADLAILCRDYPSVNTLADALRVSPDALDRELAEGLDRYIEDYIAKQHHAEWVAQHLAARQ